MATPFSTGHGGFHGPHSLVCSWHVFPVAVAFVNSASVSCWYQLECLPCGSPSSLAPLFTLCRLVVPSLVRPLKRNCSTSWKPSPSVASQLSSQCSCWLPCSVPRRTLRLRCWAPCPRTVVLTRHLGSLLFGACSPLRLVWCCC